MRSLCGLVAAAALLASPGAWAEARASEGPREDAPTVVFPRFDPTPPLLGARASLAVQPSLAVQLRGAAGYEAGGGPTPPSVELRRLRAGLRVFGLEGRLLGSFVVNTTPAALELLDAWMEYRARPGLRLRVGQGKVPFTGYRASSFTELAFVDWAPVTRVFGSERQLGVEAHNRGEPGGFEYAIGLYHGSTMRAAHGAGVAHDYREPVENRSDLRVYRALDAPHPELVGRVAWHFGRRAVWPFASNARATGLGFDLGLSASVDAAPRPAHDLAYALAPELALRWGPASLHGTGYLAWAPRTVAPGLSSLWGALLEGSVLVHPRASLALRYSTVQRSAELTHDARAHAASLVAAAREPDEQASLAQQRRLAGTIRAEHELVVGAAVALYGTLVVLQTDLGWSVTEKIFGDAVHEARIRTQVQVAF